MRKHTKATKPGQPSREVPFTAQEEADRDTEELNYSLRPPKTPPMTIEDLDARLKILEGR